MVKRGFIRTLWGVYSDHEIYKDLLDRLDELNEKSESSGLNEKEKKEQSALLTRNNFLKRRSKISADFKLLQKNPYNEPFMTYCFGQENYDFVKEMGFEAKLIHDNPIVWDIETEQYRHKMEAFKQAMEEFDEVVFLDVDTYPTAPLPKDFWETLSEKHTLQAPLRSYKRPRIPWRKDDTRKIPSASFVYMRDKEVPNHLIDLWEKMDRPWSEELVMAKYFDNLTNGWKGTDYYWDHYEPDFFALPWCFAFSREKVTTEKRLVFEHFDNVKVRKKLKEIKRSGKW